MEVKSVYMDLVEGKKNGKGVRKLESEAFKKPIEIKIGYENNELRQFNEQIDGLKHSIELHEKKLINLAGDNVNHNLFREEFQNKVNNKQYQIDELRDKMAGLSEQINQLYKAVGDIRNARDALNGVTLQLQTETKDIRKKITKQPSVYSDKTFISGHENVGLTMIDVPAGDYLVISKYVIGEHNEFVENQNDITFEKVHISGGYIPKYRLYGGTELDTPTATIYRDLVLIPC